MVAAAIGAVGAIGGAAISANGAQSAANTQAAAGNNALMWDMMSQAQTQQRQQPWVDQGTWANQQIQSGINSGRFGGSFTGQDYLNNQDPGYAFQLNQGQQALQNSQAAGSGVLSGAALKGLIGYNQGMASTGYQNAYNRWLSSQQNAYGQLHDMSSLGQNAAAQVGNNGVGYANAQTNLMTGVGNAQAAGTVGAANAASGALSNGAGYYALNSMLGSGGSGLSPYDFGANGQSNPANQAGLTNLMNQYV
jgi:hypothetical protein